MKVSFKQNTTGKANPWLQAETSLEVEQTTTKKRCLIIWPLAKQKN